MTPYLRISVKHQLGQDMNLRYFVRSTCFLNTRAAGSIIGYPRVKLQAEYLPPRSRKFSTTRPNEILTINSPIWSTLKKWLTVLGIGVSVGVGSYTFHDFLTSGSSTLAYCSEKPSGGFNFIAEAVEKAAPSVVYIEVTRSQQTFFGNFTGVASGSGFVIENGQYVLTNAHVVRNALLVDVKLDSGRVVKGEVTDIDEVADLAIIKLDLPAGTIPPLKFGDSNILRPGEWVVAMGSPLSLTNTITCGIVSCLHRPSKDLGLGENNMEYVQTDAAITIGNSGGPLVNLDGDVIGINTMTAGPGISFAIPSTVAQNFVRSANKTATGKYAQPEQNKKYMIGVSMLTLNSHITPSIQQFFSIPKDVTDGVLLTKVWHNSPAYNAGLMTGDVVVRINGDLVKSSRDMYEKVRSGKRLSVEFYRKMQYMRCTVDPKPV